MKMQDFFSALSEVSKSPYSYSAYVLLIVAWVIIGVRIKRNRELLKNLEKLPAKDRLAALSLEMDTPALTSGITPEQWLKARSQKYFLIGFGLILVLILVAFVITISIYRKNKTVGFDITLFKNETKPKDSIKTEEDYMSAMIDAMAGEDLKYPSYDFGMSMMGLIGDPEFKQLRIGYKYTNDPSAIIIQPDFPYLDTIKKNGTLIGFRYWREPFKFSLPKLSFKVVNNTDETIFLKEVQFDVGKSSVDIEPLPIFKEEFYAVGKLLIKNDGWGKLINPIISFKIIEPPNDLLETDYGNLKYKQTFNMSDDYGEININSLISDSVYKKNPYVCVTGQMSYQTENKESRIVKFKTRVSLRHPPPGFPAPPTKIYDLFLKSGKENYSVTVPISQALKAGEVDHFVFVIASDKSSNYEINAKLSSVNNAVLNDKNIKLSIIIPKSEIDYLASQKEN